MRRPIPHRRTVRDAIRKVEAGAKARLRPQLQDQQHHHLQQQQQQRGQDGHRLSSHDGALGAEKGTHTNIFIRL